MAKLRKERQTCKALYTKNLRAFVQLDERVNCISPSRHPRSIPCKGVAKARTISLNKHAIREAAIR
jgi:hypothetical protein